MNRNKIISKKIVNKKPIPYSCHQTTREVDQILARVI